MTANSEFVQTLKLFITDTKYEGYEHDLDRIDFILAAYQKDVVEDGLTKYANYYEEALRDLAIDVVPKAATALQSEEEPAKSGR